MKNYKTLRTLFMVLGLSMLAFSCGKSDSGGSSSSNTAVVPTTCSLGQTYYLTAGQSCQSGYVPYSANTCSCTVSGSAVGCQGTCQAGYAQTQYGCLPASTQNGICGGIYGSNFIQGINSGYGTGYGSSYYGQSSYYGYGNTSYYPTNYGYGGGYYPQTYRQGSWGPFTYYYGY